MPRLPHAVRPAVVIRRRAWYEGVFGRSTLWRLVAVVVFGRGLFKRLAGRNVEVLMVTALGSGRRLSVETTKPLTRRQRRRLAKAGRPVPSLAQRRAIAQAEADALVRR